MIGKPADQIPSRPRALELVERNALWVLLGMMALTAAVWFLRGRGVPAPWIFGDEFIYWELGRNLVEDGAPSIRGEVGNYYSIVIPLVAVPGQLFGSETFAYEWIKLLNPLVMALSALPAYGLARMALRPIYSLLFAATVLALPGFAYSASVMTEPIFLPAFLLAVWTLARALEEPSWLRQGMAIAAVLLAIGVRLQAISLFPAMALAVGFVVLAGASSEPGIRTFFGRLRRFSPMLVFAIATPLLFLARQRAQGSSDRELLGGYNTANVGTVDNAALYEWGLRHVAVTILAIAVLPAILALATWTSMLLRRYRFDGASAALVAGLAALLPMLVVVTIFAANNAARVQERNLFYVEPLIVLAAMIGLAGGRRWISIWLIGPAALLAGWLVLRLPLDGLLAQPPIANTMSLYAFWDAAPDFRSTPSALVAAVAVTGVVLAVTTIFVPRWISLIALPTLVAAFMITLSFQISPAVNNAAAQSAAATVPQPRDWIGDTDLDGAPVGLIWPSDQPFQLAWQAEIFNEEIETVIAVGDRPLPGLVNHGQVSADSGRIEPLAPGTRLPKERYIAAPGYFELRGRPVAVAPLLNGEMVLYEAERPLGVARTHVGYTADGWSAQETLSRQFGCSGGAFTVIVAYGHGESQRVKLTASGGEERNLILAPGEQRRLRVPAAPDERGICELRLTTPDARTDDELSGNGNPRLLGVRARPPGFNSKTS